ncbi:hypothetical protein [Nocardioides ungokensis]|uniref:hypothetical protein n=1 Tax=Nocardioides ungokensis TaxID=1643322 RepID=UPI0015DDF026|nr:hypothetical protein [Nocardioides ungokensis]
MTATVTRPVPQTAPTRLRTLGWLTVLAGAVGAAQAVAVLAWPDQVSDRHYSYPFDSTGFVVAQVSFAVQHLGLLAGLCGITLVAWRRSSRPTRTGLVLCLVGMVALTVCEIVAITAADAIVGSARADAVDNAYGVPMTVLGIGLVLAGAGLMRHPVLSGLGRWVLLALGLYLFLVLFPAVFGPMVAGRIAIGIWMLMFVGLGVSLLRADRDGVTT